jgi:hypothetical protein
LYDTLERILSESGLGSLFELRRKDDRTDQSNPHVAYRVKSNYYRIRSIELWGNKDKYFFRIYHAENMVNKLKSLLSENEYAINSKKLVIDFETEDYIQLAKEIKEILQNEDIINACRHNSRVARTSRFEGLDLPDVDTSSYDNVLGHTFNWREIIAIWEDDSEENELKNLLSNSGIYIQRSKDGQSRYIGSASGEGGIIARWVQHLNALGDAHHLNLFVLESGYNELVFSVIEFCEDEDILQREKMWKQALGTINYGPYNGLQLNRN